MLLARGQREHEAAAALGVDGLAHEPTGQLANEALARAQETQVRSADPHGNPEALRLATHDVRTQRARRLQERQ
jgi:hypothetical protein